MLERYGKKLHTEVVWAAAPLAGIGSRPAEPGSTDA
jgi:hypothetical protein